MTRLATAPVLVGAFPPPTHGMALVNAAVLRQLRERGVEPSVINLAARNLERSFVARVRRLPMVLVGLLNFLRVARSRRPLYMNVSGGFGQVYETAFLLLARIMGMRVFLHHHCSSYLYKDRLIAKLLITAAGGDCVHIIQSPKLARNLSTRYGVSCVVHVSNAVFLTNGPIEATLPRRSLRVMGFLSNVSADKGIFEFLDLMEATVASQLPVVARVAGPFQDEQTRNAVMKRLRSLPSVTYVGPVFGSAKEEFLRSIDVLVFPTRYEMEGMVNHEAMSHGVPVIAYGHGAIPEIIDRHCGKVIDPADPFVPAALAQIQAWLSAPVEFERASIAAPRKFEETLRLSAARWSEVLEDLAGKSALDPDVSSCR